MILIFRKFIPAEVLPKRKQPALAQLQNRPQQPGGAGNGPLPFFGPTALNPVRDVVLSDADSDADTYFGDDVLPVAVGWELVSVHLSDWTRVEHYVMLEEERSMVGPSTLITQLRLSLIHLRMSHGSFFFEEPPLLYPFIAISPFSHAIR